MSRYPAISHTFILREVLALQEIGFEIHPASINDCDRPADRLTPEERTEASRTFYVKSKGAFRALRAMALTLLANPGRFFDAVLFTMRLAGTDLRRIRFCFFYLAEAALLARWMRTNRLRHIHVHFATPAATVALLLSKLAPIRFSMTVHGPDEFYDVDGQYLVKKIEAAEFVIAISFFARSQLMKLSAIEHWQKFEVARMGVDPSLFAPRPFRADPDPFEILCVGRLTPAKGQQILLEAVQILQHRHRQVRLRIIGDGPDRQSLDAACEALRLRQVVQFEGAVNQDRIRDFYQSADVFALASFAEGIPVVLMEAMAMEIPCITTWITGIPELIHNGLDGLLVPPSDPAALADAITRLMDDPELRQRLGKAGRQTVIEHYNLATNTLQLAEIFHRRLGGAA